MKKDWKIKKLEEVTQICLGLTHTPKYQETGIPFISVKDISSGNLSFDNTKRISKEEYDSMPWGAKPKKEDVLFCRVGTIGIPQIVKTDDDFGIFVSVGFFRTYDTLFNEYLKYWLYSDNFFYQVEKNVVGSTIKNLNTGWLKNFTLPVPPLEEQKRIVKILDEKFAQLETIKANAQTNLQNAKDLFQSQLTKAFSNTTWEKKRLGDVCDIINGKNQKLVEDSNGQYPIYGSGGIIGYATDYICRENTTIIGRKGSINNPIYVEQKFWNVDTAFGFQSKDICLPKLLFYFCKSFDFSTHNKGTTIPSLVKSDLLEIEIRIPPLSEQKRIVEELDILSEKVKALCAIYEKQIADCEELKQSFLCKAFAGEL